MLLNVCFVEQMQYICQGKYKSVLLSSEYFLSEIVFIFGKDLILHIEYVATKAYFFDEEMVEILAGKEKSLLLSSVYVLWRTKQCLDGSL